MGLKIFKCTEIYNGVPFTDEQKAAIASMPLIYQYILESDMPYQRVISLIRALWAQEEEDATTDTENKSHS